MKPQIIAFENPPVNEVVVSTYFNPPLSDFRNEHVGLFWEGIRKDFPVVRQQIPVGIEQEITADELIPMPRYWFISDNDMNLIQLQKNAFMFNWRRRDKEYPRFHDYIKPTFDKYYSFFSDFIRSEINSAEELAVELCELTYINTLEPCEYWEGPQDTANIIPSFSIVIPGIDISNSPGFYCHYAYEIATDLQLNIRIHAAAKSEQPDVPALIFEIKVSGRVGKAAKPKTDEWFERAHEAIAGCFAGMTNPEVQVKYWKRVEEKL